MENLISCNDCGKQISKNASKCLGCGSPIKKPKAKKPDTVPRWIIAIIVVTLVFLVLGGETEKTEPVVTKPSIEEYEGAETLDYRKAMLGEMPKGQLTTFVGEVSQIISNGAMIATGASVLGYIGDRVYVTFNTDRVMVVGDVIRFYGRNDGTRGYRTVLGAHNEVPEFIVDYYEIVQARD